MREKTDFIALSKLAVLHVLLILFSNVLVQYPFTIWRMHSTWGAITYPLIFILSDLTTRLCGVSTARKVVLLSMFPGLLLSYIVSSYFANGMHLDIFKLYDMPLRIASACFVAYVVGQLLDITVFQRFRNNRSWWLAPTLSSVVGNLVDTVLFFSIAFYNCSDNFLSLHWPEIALVDMTFKIIISILAFVPIYGMLLTSLKSKAFTPEWT